MKKYITSMTIILILFFSVKSFFLNSANYDTKVKLRLIKNEVIRLGYSPKWFIISEKRDEWYNSILLNSAKKSLHLVGKAVDIYIIDIDGDFDFDQNDIKILERANKVVEKNNSHLKGGFGTYTNRDYFSSHMVHIDTRGYCVRFNK